MKTEIREIRPEDRQALIALWHRVFEDPEELAAAFLELLPDLGSGVAAFADGILVGAAYIVTALTVGQKRAAYLYAVAVAPGYRGLGLGGKLSRRAAALGRERGADFVCTLPASASLYGWYEGLIGTRCVLYRREETLPARSGPTVSVLSPGDYHARREALLEGAEHMTLSPAAAVYESVNCRCFGGDLYAVGNGIAAAYRENGHAVIRELLCPDASQRRICAAAVADAMGCAHALLFSPGGTEDLPFLAAEPGAIPPDCVWNLAFD